MSQSIYVIDAVRTAIGKYAGTLSATRPDDMGAHVIKALINRNPNIPFEETEEVILGAANQAGEDNRNVAYVCFVVGPSYQRFWLYSQ